VVAKSVGFDHPAFILLDVIRNSFETISPAWSLRSSHQSNGTMHQFQTTAALLGVAALSLAVGISLH
jgi:hypothetical protein